MQRKFAWRSKPLQICAAEYLHVNLVDCPVPQTWTLGLWWCTCLWSCGPMNWLMSVQFMTHSFVRNTSRCCCFQVTSGEVVQKKKAKNPRIYCCNCAKGGHFAFVRSIDNSVLFSSMVTTHCDITVEVVAVVGLPCLGKSLPCLGKAATCARVVQLDLIWLYCNAFCLGYLKDVTSRDSSVVRAPDLWLKGHGFESLQEQRENFLLQSQLSVLTLISVSVPPPCYRSSM